MTVALNEPESSTTSWNVAPNESQWYWCAIVEDANGETDYCDGYTSGSDEPEQADAPISDTVTVLEWTVQMTSGHQDYVEPTRQDDPTVAPSTSDTDDTDGM